MGTDYKVTSMKHGLALAGGRWQVRSTFELENFIFFFENEKSLVPQPPFRSFKSARALLGYRHFFVLAIKIARYDSTF